MGSLWRQERTLRANNLWVKLKGWKKSTTHMVQGRACQAKGLENAGSTGHLAPAGQEDVVVSEEVTHWAGEDGKKEKEDNSWFNHSPLKDGYIYPSLRLLQIKLLWKCVYKLLPGVKSSFLWDKCLKIARFYAKLFDLMVRCLTMSTSKVWPIKFLQLWKTGQN